MKDHFIKYSDFYISFGLTFLFYVLVAIFAGFHYENKDDFPADSMIRGFYYGAPVVNFYFFLHIIPHFFNWLYTHADFGINYWGGASIFCTYIAHSILGYLILKSNNFKYRVLVILLFLFACLNNIYLVSFTKTSIILSFAALLFIFYNQINNKTGLSKYLIYFVCSFLIIYAYFLRPVSALYALMLAIPLIVVFQIYAKIEIKKIILNSGLILIPFIIAYASVSIYSKKYDAEYTKQMAQVWKYNTPIIDYKYPTKFSNQHEEHVLFCVKSWFYLNKETTDPSIIKNIVDLSFFARFNIIHVIDLIKLLAHKAIFAFFVFVFFAIPLFFLVARRKIPWLLLLISGWVFAVIFGVTLVTKFREHVAIAAFTIVVFYVFYNYDKYLSIISQNDKIKKILFILLICAVPLQIYNYVKNIKRSQSLTGSSIERLNNLYKFSENKTVFFSLAAKDFEDYNALSSYQWNKTATYIPMHGWNSLHEMNYKKIKELTGSNDLDQIFTWIANNPQAVILSDENGNKLMNQIMAYYNRKLDFEPVVILDPLNKIYLYKIKII